MYGRPKHWNDAFYIKKRALFHKANSVKKSFDCDVFILVHEFSQDKIYPYSSNEKEFTIEKITSLILREMREGLFLKKNRMFEDSNFKNLNNDISELSKLKHGGKLDPAFNNTFSDQS